MILAIDIGNTYIEVGGFEGDRSVFVENFSTDKSETDLEYLVKFITLTELYGVKREAFDGAIISSVVPTLNTVIKSAVKKFCGVDAILVGPGIKTGLSIHMDNPGMVGTDLIVNSVAGLEKYGAPLIIVDMGTATTLSVIDDKKSYIGGAIVPGITVSLESLVEKTSMLPNISIDTPSRVIGKNTIDGMKSGLVFGHAASIDGIIEKMWSELGYNTKVIATGVIPDGVIDNCKTEMIVDEELTLTGLRIIYDKNKR